MELSALIQSVLLVVLPVLAVSILVYLVKAWQVKKAELSQQQWSLLQWVVSSAIWSTEQAERSGLIAKTGKLKYAIDLIQKEIDARGLPGVKVDAIVAAINAAIAQELNKAKFVATPQATKE